MQAILTKLMRDENGNTYISAVADAGSLIAPKDHSLNYLERHETAAQQLIEKLGWDELEVTGSGDLPGEAGLTMVHILGRRQ